MKKAESSLVFRFFIHLDKLKAVTCDSVPLFYPLG